MIMKTITPWIFSRLGLKGSEFALIVVGIVTFATVGGLFKHLQVVRADRAIAAEAAASAKAVQRQQEVDVASVLSWLEERDKFRRSQQKVLDTTFLQYFQWPRPLETIHPPDIFIQGPYGPSLEEEDNEPSAPSVSPQQRRAVANGLWESYCLSVVDDPDC